VRWRRWHGKGGFTSSKGLDVPHYIRNDSASVERGESDGDGERNMNGR